MLVRRPVIYSGTLPVVLSNPIHILGNLKRHVNMPVFKFMITINFTKLGFKGLRRERFSFFNSTKLRLTQYERRVVDTFWRNEAYQQSF